MQTNSLKQCLIRCAILAAFCATGLPVWAAPGDVLYENNFSSNGDLNGDWDRSSNDVEIERATYNSAGSSVLIPAGENITLENNRSIDADLPAVEVSIWVQRGESGLFPYPEDEDDFEVQYLNDQGNWTTLETFLGGGPAEEEFFGSYPLPADGLHGQLRLRFQNISPSPFDADYWYLDDVIVTEIAPPVTSPVGHWQFDEFVWNETPGEVLDATGNGMHGTARGNASTDDANPAIGGNPGTCRYGEFDGEGDYIGVSGLSDTLNATASLAFWIRTTQTGNDTAWQAPGVTGVEEEGGDDDIFWGWLDSAGRIGLSVGNTYTTKSTVAVNDGTWRHVVLTRDHNSGSYKIYIDGNLNASGNIAAGEIGNGFSSIGRIEDTAGSHEYLAGQLDEVRIYDGVLSDSQVLTIRDATHPCAAALCPTGVAQGGLIGTYYDGTDPSGTPVGTRVDGPVNFDWEDGSPGVSGTGANQFAIEWNGYVRVMESGEYKFQTVSDDGVRLTVAEQVVIDNWTDHAQTVDTSSSLSLVAGQAYPITLEFYENGGQAEIRLQWLTPSASDFVPIPRGPDPLAAGLYSCTTNAVDHYGISPTSGITCEAEAITITAYDAGGNAFIPPAGTQIDLSTAPASGTWANGASYVFGGSETSATKYLRQTTPATLNINVTDGSATEAPGSDPDILFAEVGLRFYADTGASPFPNQVAGVPDPDPVLRAVETDSDTGACTARVENSSHPVRLAYECRDPVTCSSGGQVLSLGGAGVQANNGGSAIAYTNVDLAFDAQGFATIPFEFSDVGRVQLHGQLDLPEDGDEPATTVTGSSTEFVVKPDSLAIINVETASGTANPGSMSGSPGFAASGAAFVTQVEARNAYGDRTPAFGRESAPEDIQVNIDELLFPNGGGSEGTLANSAGFNPVVSTPGVYENTSLSWNEVGTIRLLPFLEDGNYLGAGDVNNADAVGADVGRFYPAEFNLASSAVGNSCTAGANSFTYLSEPGISVNYTIEARNQAGDAVSNYDNLGLDYPAASVSLHAENNNDGIDLGSVEEDRLATTENGDWDGGVLELEDNAVTVKRLLCSSDSSSTLCNAGNDGSVVREKPLTSMVFGLQINDGDGVDFGSPDFKPDDDNDCDSDNDCNSKRLGGVIEARFGRLSVQDAHGPESSPIPMEWKMDYWDGDRFVLNSDDQCTALPLSAVTFIDASSTVDDANDTIDVTLDGITSRFDFSDPDSAVLDNCLSSTAIGFCHGSAGIAYGAPGAAVTFPIHINLSAPELAWMRGDWDQDGDYNDPSHPPVHIRFQHYRGHDRIIYWREILE